MKQPPAHPARTGGRVSDGPPFIAVDSLVKSFGGVEVLKCATVWGHAGRMTAILGRNGCGKTTLLRIAAGVLSPDSGTVRLDGQIIERPRLHTLAARGIFFLPTRGLLSPRLRVADQMESGAWAAGTRGSLAGVVERFALASLLRNRGAELSGGERRRAEFALAVLCRPRCLLADEPFAGIAPRDLGLISGELRALAAGGCAVIATGHEVPELLGLADEIVWMSGGTAHWLGPTATALEHDQFRREYLGPIYGGAPFPREGAPSSA
jgi:lipopolysaccharide export system ATP-binding protein